MFWMKLFLPLARLAHVPRLFTPHRQYDRPLKRAVVLHRGQSPTTDIYLRPRFQRLGIQAHYRDILKSPAPEDLQDGDFVIVVRYLNPRWAAALRRARAKLSGVAYLLDDDIPAAGRDRNLPRHQATNLTVFWAGLRPVMASLVSEIWVTSDGLLSKYGDRGVHRIDPLYLGRKAADTPAVRVFYHGGRTHRLDSIWIAEVARKVQKRSQITVFEVFGDRRIAQAFRDIPRCRVLHPMPWPAFRDYTSTVELDIGLAPLTASHYNAARSHNKLFEITRTGAAGIFADVVPFNEVIEHDRTGLLVAGDDADAWADAILALVEDPARRARLHAAARELCDQLTEKQVDAPAFDRFRGPRT